LSNIILSTSLHRIAVSLDVPSDYQQVTNIVYGTLGMFHAKDLVAHPETRNMLPYGFNFSRQFSSENGILYGSRVL
jgi:hypothetical protein